MTRRDWKLGEVCEHGSLGRKCDRCDRDEDIAELREDRTLLLAVLKAAREIDIAEEGWERQMFILQGCVTACQHIMTDTPKPVTREPVEITGVSNPTADMEREIADLRTRLLDAEVTALRASLTPRELTRYRWLGARASEAAAASALSANITIILGRGAFSVSELSGEEMSIIIKRPGANTTSDPFDLMHTASFKLRSVAAVTNPSSGVLLIGVDPGSVTG